MTTNETPAHATPSRGAGIPIVAAAFLLILAFAALWLWISPTPGASNVGDAAADTPSSATLGSPDLVPPHGPQPDSLSVSVCGLDGTDTPITALSDAQAVDVAGIRVPSLPHVGPGSTEGVASCYEKSPAGAVLAATGYLAFFSQYDDLEAVFTSRVYPDEVREKMFAELEGRDEIPVRTVLQFHGFSIDEWTADRVTVALAVSLPGITDELVSWPLNLVWHEGDWKIAASGEPGVTAIASLEEAGMSEWEFPQR